MGVPYHHTEMTSHPQYLTVRNARGQELLDTVGDQLQRFPTASSGQREPFVLQTVEADDQCALLSGQTSARGARAE